MIQHREGSRWGGTLVAGMTEARKKILCIEDDRETAKLIAEELSERGFYPLIAYDSHVGLAAILKKIPDLVLCDIGMPEMSGFEVLKRWKERAPRFSRMPFVFLTGLSDRDNELQGRSLGADDYVTKPVDFDILEAIIRARLAGGIARHEISAKLAKPNDRLAEASAQAAFRRAFSKRAVSEEIVELIDAPPVDFHPENAKPIAGTSAQEEPTVKTAVDRFIKP
jgi:DNA-binding response OmpR family regulator